MEALAEAINAILAILVTAVLLATAAALVVAAMAIVAVITAAGYILLLPALYALVMWPIRPSAPTTDDDKDDDKTDDEDTTFRLHWSAEKDEMDTAFGGGSRLGFGLRDLGRTHTFEKSLRSGQMTHQGNPAHEDQLVAIQSYFLGPFIPDLYDVIRRLREAFSDAISWGAGHATDLTADRTSIWSVIGMVGIMAGLVAGGFVGAVEGVLLLAISVVVAMVGVAASVCLLVLLRSADWLRRRLRQVALTCPDCGEPAEPYPVYRCPHCQAPHHDTRPGRYGLSRRVCSCLEHFPTLLVIGSGRIPADCPKCGAALLEGFGVDPDIVIPFFGALNAGKTQLVFRFIDALSELADISGGKLILENDAPGRLARIREDLASDGRPAKTPPGPPGAYVLRLLIGMHKRVILIFDAAGEQHYTGRGLEGLPYLTTARVLVYVVDPLSAEKVWSRLEHHRQQELIPIRSNRDEVYRAYEATREHARMMGKNGRRGTLAFVISKSDLLDGLGVEADGPMSGRQVREWMQKPEGLDMGGMIREAMQGFSSVEFFRTSAVAQPGSGPDESVEVLARWIMESLGIKFDRRRSYGS